MHTSMQSFIEELGGLSYLGIFGISLVANILFIIPEEIVLLGMGYVARAGNIDIFIVIPLVILGLLISDLILYSLSRGNNRLIHFLYDRIFSKRIAFFSKTLSGDEAWMENNVHKVVFYVRFLMQLRFLGPYMAGRHRLPRKTFFTYELAALIVYVPLLLWIGWYFRSRFETIISRIDVAHNIVLALVLLLLFLPFLQRIFRGAISTLFRSEQ